MHPVTVFVLCRSSEGKTVEIPYRGDATNTVLDILGGLRSACTYTGEKGVLLNNEDGLKKGTTERGLFVLSN